VESQIGQLGADPQSYSSTVHAQPLHQIGNGHLLFGRAQDFPSESYGECYKFTLKEGKVLN